MLAQKVKSHSFFRSVLFYISSEGKEPQFFLDQFCFMLAQKVKSYSFLWSVLFYVSSEGKESQLFETSFVLC